ncbi:hypothetical protein [Bacillus sp. REN3]|uniref:hypothetical protein n=1 Tax=Bacillus sp. REN3 TaxID=2802440 RepID=UPI001AED8B5F|nr:hypothetical protein [Bacillus sp. REN3]
MEKKAESGHFLGGRVFGYETYNKELSIVPEEASVVKYIFEKYALDMWGYRRIAANEMVTILGLFNDDTLNLDSDMLKDQLVTKQEEINKKKSNLDDITNQLEIKRSKSIMEIIKFSISNFKDFYLTILSTMFNN